MRSFGNMVPLALLVVAVYVRAEFTHEIDMPHAEPANYTPGPPAIYDHVIYTQAAPTANIGLATRVFGNPAANFS